MPTLPNYHKSLAKAALLRKNRYFPSIYRFIPEYTLDLEKTRRNFPLIIILAVSLYLFISSVFQLFTFLGNQQQLTELAAQRQAIASEISYWRETASKYPQHPDIYLKIAQLEYSRGEVQNAQNYLQKALSLNPHSEKGTVLGEQIKRGEE